MSELASRRQARGGGATGAIGTAIVVEPPVPGALAGEVGRRLLFVSPEITGYRLDTTDDGDLRGVTLYSAAPLEAGTIAGKLDYILDTYVRPLPANPASVVWVSPHHREARPAYPELAEAGVVTMAGEGQVAIGEPVLSLLEFFDRLVLEVLAEEFDATAYRYPTLIRTGALAKAGYFTSFPQHLMLVTRLRNDIDVYREFQRSYGTDGLTPDVLTLGGNVDYCLPPTMCYHTFHQHEGRTLGADRLHVITARGKSFRYEAGYATTLERLWDFTIREIVFLGGRDEVLAARESFMRKVFAVIEDLGLSGTCEAGNDPFFGGSDTPGRIWSQRLLGLKYELRLPVAASGGPDRDIAVASFNFHDDLFGRAFDIGLGEPDGDREITRSGCVGFGLERLTYAFLCQYGAAEAAWPERVRAGLREAR